MNPNGNRRLAINLLANIISYSTNILIAFILTPYLINTLGKETYSFYPIANNFVAYMAILTTALNSMAGRFVTVSIVKGYMEDARYFVSSVLFSNIIMGMFLLLPMSAIIIFIDRIMDVPLNIVAAVRILFSFVFASMLIQIFSSVLGVATFVRNRIDLRSAMQLTSGILKIILFYALFKFFSPTIVYVGVVAFIVAISEFLFQRFYFKRLLPEIKISQRYFSVSHVKTVLSSGCWNSVNSIGNLLLVSSSLIMANILYGAASGGIYSIVNTVPLFINGVISMLVGVFAPSITYSFASGRKSELVHTVEKSQAMIGMFACSVIVVFVCLCNRFFQLWTPSEDADLLSKLSFITIMPHFFIGCLWPLTNLNMAANKVAKPALVQLALGVINIIMVVLLSRMFHTGLMTISAVCSFLTVALVLGFMPLYTSYYLKISYATFYKVVLRMMLSALFLIVLFFAVGSQLALDNWFRLLGTGVLMGIVALSVNFMIILNKTTRQRILSKITKRLRYDIRHI